LISRYADTSELRAKWEALIKKLARQFGEEPDLQAILFLIGVQELGMGAKKFSKDEKMSLMHIATCRLLSKWGFYERDGTDSEGWPKWKNKDKLPKLTLGQQEYLLREAILEYFDE
jgi:hypothetical protein